MKVPKHILKLVIDSYSWGFNDAKECFWRKSEKEIELHLNKGFKRGLVLGKSLK